MDDDDNEMTKGRTSIQLGLQLTPSIDVTLRSHVSLQIMAPVGL